MATPVLCWHHHLYETSAARTVDRADNDAPSLSSFKGAVLQNHCAVCAHHFTVCEPAAAWSYHFAAGQLPTNYSVYHATALTAAVHRFSNKGPPTEPVV